MKPTTSLSGLLPFLPLLQALPTTTNTNTVDTNINTNLPALANLAPNILNTTSHLEPRVKKYLGTCVDIHYTDGTVDANFCSPANACFNVPDGKKLKGLDFTGNTGCTLYYHPKWGCLGAGFLLTVDEPARMNLLPWWQDNARTFHCARDY